MHWCLVATLVVAVGATKLDRTYLPPETAKTADGSSANLKTPFANHQAIARTRSQGNQGLGGIPSGGFTNDFQGVVVEAAEPGTRNAGVTGLGGPRSSYGSEASKVGEDAFKITDLDGSQQQAPGYQPRPAAEADKNANTIRFDSDVGPDSFKFAFETDNGISAAENAITTNGVQAQGSYSYTGDDGKLYSISYTADENGYRPSGSHLPTPPPIPEAILKSLERNAQDEADGVIDDGAYDARKYNSGDYNENNNASGDNGKQSNEHGTEAASSYSAESGPFINDNVNAAFNQNQRGSSGSSMQRSHFKQNIPENHNKVPQHNQYPSQTFPFSHQEGNILNMDIPRSRVDMPSQNNLFLRQAFETAAIEHQNSDDEPNSQPNYDSFADSIINKDEENDHESLILMSNENLAQFNGEHMEDSNENSNTNSIPRSDGRLSQALTAFRIQPSNQYSSLDYSQKPENEISMVPLLNQLSSIMQNHNEMLLKETQLALDSNHNSYSSNQEQPSTDLNNHARYSQENTGRASYYTSASTETPVSSTGSQPENPEEQFVHGVTQAAAYSYPSSLNDNHFPTIPVMNHRKTSANNPTAQFQTTNSDTYPTTESSDSSEVTSTVTVYGVEIYEYKKPEQTLPPPDQDKYNNVQKADDSLNAAENVKLFDADMNQNGMKLLSLPQFEKLKQSFYNSPSFGTAFKSKKSSHQSSENTPDDSKSQSLTPNSQSHETSQPLGSNAQISQTASQTIKPVDTASRFRKQHYDQENLNYKSQITPHSHTSKTPNTKSLVFNSSRDNERSSHEPFNTNDPHSKSLVESNSQESVSSPTSIDSNSQNGNNVDLKSPETGVRSSSSLFQYKTSEFTGPAEVFEGQRNPPRYDETGYHY